MHSKSVVFLGLLLFALTTASSAQSSEWLADVEELDQQLQDHLTRLEVRGEGARPSTAKVRREAASLRERLHQLYRQAPDRSFDTKLQALAALVSNLERAADHPAEGLLPTDALATPHATPIRSSSPAVPPPNDACAQATPVALGTVLGNTTLATADGSATCGASLDGQDVWFKFTAPKSGLYYANTFGSDFDTVLSAHTACPGTTANQRSCDDDSFGLQSSIQIYLQTGSEIWLRVSGFSGASGSATLNIGQGGTIQGTVTEEGSGDAIPNTRVQIYNTDGYSVATAYVETDGTFSYGSLEPGTYYAATNPQYFGPRRYLHELFEEISCPANLFQLDCDPTTGTPLNVGMDETIENIDFTLALGGTVSGRVVDHDGHPLRAEIEIWNASGDRIINALQDADGHYEFPGLEPGTYFVTAIESRFSGQVWNGGACTDPPRNCDPTTGSPVAVRAGETTSGIDFTLDRRAQIHGRVVDATSGEPIDGQVLVYSQNSAFHWEERVSTQPDGTYQIGGLDPGRYYILTKAYGYADQLHLSLSCDPDCNPHTGTPVELQLNDTLTGLDFALRQQGRITGVVTDATTGSPLSSVRVVIYEANGRYHSGRTTDVSGVYESASLTAGQYYAVTNTSTHANETYEDLPCNSLACDPTTGLSIQVADEVLTTGVDFALDPGASLSGAVTDSAGQPIDGKIVVLWNASGEKVQQVSSDSQGLYELSNIAAGTYYVSTASRSYYPPDLFSNEVFDNLPCPEDSCDPTTGQPLTLTAGQAMTGIDFALDVLGIIEGTITHAITAEPLDVRIEIFDENGRYVDSERSSYTDGTYRFAGLAEGTYFIQTDDGFEYIDELFANTQCPSSCDPTKGTPISVSPDTIRIADLQLAPRHGIVGRVVDDETGEPQAGISINLWRSYLVETTTTSESGHFVLDEARGSRYVVSTDAGDLWINQVFAGIECPVGSLRTGTCSRDSATEIEVGSAVGSVVYDVDFRLRKRGSTVFQHDFEDGTMSSWTSSP